MDVIWILSITAASVACVVISAIILLTIKARRRQQAKAGTGDTYVAISTGIDSNLASCYSTEYVQCPHKQIPLERSSTIPFELPVAPNHGGLAPVENPAALSASSTSLYVTDPEQVLTSSSSSYCLGAIDPELYQLDNDDNVMYDFPDTHIGRLWFSVEYKDDTERLLVTVLRARNLRTRSMGFEGTCDSYVRVQLMPEKRRVLQTKLRKRTINPNYEESFVFQVSSKELHERILQLTVYHVTRHKKHMMVGHAIYPLRDHDFARDEKSVIWRDLECDGEVVAEKGELFVSLCYNNQHERITVGIFQAKDWSVEQQQPADFYCKVSLSQQNRIVKTKKTDIVKKTNSPTFNESFIFKLGATQTDTASVSIQAMQYYIGHKDKCIGRITLGPYMFARGKELSHWNEMIANPKEQIAYFHKLS